MPSLKETTKVTKLKNVQTSLKPPFETAQPLKTKNEFKDVIQAYPAVYWYLGYLYYLGYLFVVGIPAKYFDF